MLPLLAWGVGVYLGLYFNFLVLVPFSVVGLGTCIVSSWAAGQSVADSAVSLLFPMFAIQAGYIIGLTARDAFGQILARLNTGQSRRI